MWGGVKTGDLLKRDVLTFSLIYSASGSRVFPAHLRVRETGGYLVPFPLPDISSPPFIETNLTGVTFLMSTPFSVFVMSNSS